MKAKVDPDICTGCGPCEDICPEVFLIENDVANVIVDEVPPEAETRCQEAMLSCPVEAISIDD